MFGTLLCIERDPEVLAIRKDRESLREKILAEKVLEIMLNAKCRNATRSMCKEIIKLVRDYSKENPRNYN